MISVDTYRAFRDKLSQLRSLINSVALLQEVLEGRLSGVEAELEKLMEQSRVDVSSESSVAGKSIAWLLRSFRTRAAHRPTCTLLKNALEDRGIRTVGDLLGVTEREVLSCRMVGQTCLRILQLSCEERGVPWPKPSDDDD